MRTNHHPHLHAVQNYCALAQSQQKMLDYQLHLDQDGSAVHQELVMSTSVMSTSAFTGAWAYIQGHRSCRSCSWLLQRHPNGVIEVGVSNQATWVDCCTSGQCYPIVHKISLLVHIVLWRTRPQSVGRLIFATQLSRDHTSDISANHNCQYSGKPDQESI